MSLTDLRKIIESRSSPTLKKLRSPPYAYRIPKTHLSWELISAIAALCTDMEPNEEVDIASYFHLLAWRWWVEDNLPTYCLSNNLLRDFEQTDIAGLAKLIDDSWNAPMPGMLLLLPNSAILNADGNSIPYLIISINDGKNKTPFATEHKRQVSVFFADNSETTWMTGFGLGSGEILFRENPGLGKDFINKDDETFLANIRAIALQTILALTYLPELIDSGIPGTPKGFSKKERDRPSYRVPRWIGKDYQRQQKSAPSSNPQGTHASPHAHWRRGHWRHQSHGIGMKERKLIWIKPIWISG